MRKMFGLVVVAFALAAAGGSAEAQAPVPRGSQGGWTQPAHGARASVGQLSGTSAGAPGAPALLGPVRGTNAHMDPHAGTVTFGSPGESGTTIGTGH